MLKLRLLLILKIERIRLMLAVVYLVRQLRRLLRLLLLIDLLVNSNDDALVAIFYNLVNLLIRFIAFSDQARGGNHLPVPGE